MENQKRKQCIPIYNHEDKIYDIILSHSFDMLVDSMKELGLENRKVCIVTESNVAPLYLRDIYQIMSGVAKETVTFSFTEGEENKQLKTIESIYEHLIKHHFDRKDVLIALGGGVVGDMTGYAAATYLRGIDFVQIPTTLLAQVDSGIGGKTGVDFLQYKNMVGAFHQPKLVYINTSTLISLPERTYYAGMGEVIKHGLIKDAAYYQWIKEHVSEIKERKADVLEEMIYRSCEIKAGVVQRDPKEQGERAQLNFGHTLGHAIEKLMNFTWLHGECVGIGCQLAAMISKEKGHITQEEVQDIKNSFQAFGLYKSMNQLDAKEIIQATKSDKKMVGDYVKFILLQKIGEAYIDTTVSDQEMENALESWT